MSKTLLLIFFRNFLSVMVDDGAGFEPVIAE